MKTAIVVLWKLTGRIELFTTLSKVYKAYPSEIMDISIHTLYKKDLKEGFENDIVKIIRLDVL